MGKGGEMNAGKGDESGGYENPNYPVVVGEDGVPRIGPCAVDPLQSFKSTELQLWPIFGNKLSFARPHMRAFHFQWLSFFMAFMVWFAYAPLLVVIRQDLDIPKKGIWMSNVFNVAACVVAGCDSWPALTLTIRSSTASTIAPSGSRDASKLRPTEANMIAWRSKSSCSGDPPKSHHVHRAQLKSPGPSVV